MHITLESDYAIRIVDCIARKGERVGAKAISEESMVTLRFSLKILRKLVTGGIVRSYKGVQGGYELARPAGQVTLGEIIAVIEGPYFISRCLRDGYDCPRRSEQDDEFCAYHELFKDLSEQLRERLDSVTIAQMIGHTESA